MSGDLQANLRPRGFSRLARVRSLATFPLALALGLATAFALVSCGGEDAKLLPGTTAQEITDNLDTVKRLASEGECVGAADAAQEVGAQVEALEDVDPKLKRALQAGVTRLDEVVTTCEETTAETTAPSTETTTTERSQPPGQQKKAEREQRESEAREPEEERTSPGKGQPAETTPAETPSSPAEEGGGTGAPGGISPAEPAAPEGEG